MWAKSPYYVTPQLSRNTSVDVPSRAASRVSSRQPSVDSQMFPRASIDSTIQQPSSSSQLTVPDPATVQPQFHTQIHAKPILLKPSIVIDVEKLATEPAMDSPPLFPVPNSAMASKRNSAVIVEEIMRSRALMRVKRQTTRELRFSFTESRSPSVETTNATRPRFHSISHNTEFVQHRISQPPEPVNIIDVEPKISRKPTSYYEVYPLEAYDNITERQKRKHMAKHDPRYQVSLREEIENRKYTLIALGICILVFIFLGGFTIWQLVQDFTIDF
ncbi:hypothetical protein PFISCL1PPCAC_2822 [Pristionchus fissidentatus]|uniref:Uncharacterized protein n=1 Tax=Pristionchus fissidentatus TaxID=1538716 RepID=A0AAV5UW81_9BILA|nr:hypothetical protein PFISCL1PPCAC_2822 [Pristionchus fissidentatus]